MRSTSQLAWMKCVSTDRFTVPCQIEAKLQASSFRSFTWQWGVCFSCLLLLQFQSDTQRLKNSHLFRTRWAHLWRDIFIISSLSIQFDPICCSHPSVQFWFSAQVRWCTSHNQSDPFWHHPLMMDQTQYPPAIKVAPSPQRGSVLWFVG